MIKQEDYDKAVELVKSFREFCSGRPCDFCPFCAGNGRPSCLLNNLFVSAMRKPEPPALFTPQDVAFIENLENFVGKITKLIIAHHYERNDISYNLSWGTLKIHKTYNTDWQMFPNIKDDCILVDEQIQAEIAKVKESAKQ